MLLAFGLGSGLAPKAPGTWGSLLAAALAPLLFLVPLWIAWTVVVTAAVGGIFLCGVAVRRLGVPDHPGIVWDEFVGLWLAVLIAPQNWPSWLGAFALFRVFDIVKPWPVSWFDRRCGGGFGVMADDLVAGLLAGGAIQLWRLVS